MTCKCAVPYKSTRPLAGYRQLGRLGTSAGQAAEGIGVSVASKAGGAAVSSAAVSAGVVAAGGIAAGVLTAGVGLVIAFALGKLLTKNYLNVPQMNAAEDQDVAAYNQYLTIMGQAPGRAFGLTAMLAVFRGANHSGLFPQNNGVQCFHEGCSKYPGRADWVNGFVNDYGVHGNINFPDAYFRFSQDRRASDFGPLAYNPHPSPGVTPQTYTAAATPPALPPGAPTAQPQSIARVATPVRIAPLARGLSMRGLGQAASSGADAVNFIDNFLLPYNQAHNTWVVPNTNTEHQILYDVADAYLASKGLTTTPYVASPPAAVAPPVTQVPAVPVPPNLANTMMPNYSPVPVPPTAQPVYSTVVPTTPPPPAVPPPEASIPYYGTTMPTVDNSGALVNPTLPPGSVPAMTAGLSNLPPWLLAAAGGLLLVSFALARPVGSPPKGSATP